MRALLLWLLILAQPVYGVSSAQVRLLGPAHWHTSTTSAAQNDWLQPALQWVQHWMQRVQEVREQAHVRAHAFGQKHEHRHEHSGLQHHWHDAQDDSVHTVASADPAVGDLVAGAAAGSAALVLAVSPSLTLPVEAPSQGGRWPPAPTSRWSDADAATASPPPRH